MAPGKLTATGADLEVCQRYSEAHFSERDFDTDFSEVKWGSEAEGT